MNGTLFIIAGAALIIIAIFTFVAGVIYKKAKVNNIKSRVINEYE